MVLISYVGSILAILGLVTVYLFAIAHKIVSEIEDDELFRLQLTQDLPTNN